MTYAELTKERDELKQEIERLNYEYDKAFKRLKIQQQEIDKLRENERLKADGQVLIEALRYMANMYGFRLDMNKYDDEIEYSCNQYVTDRETWLTLKKAEKIIDWWE